MVDSLFNLQHHDCSKRFGLDTRFDIQVQNAAARFILWGFFVIASVPCDSNLSECGERPRTNENCT